MACGKWLCEIGLLVVLHQNAKHNYCSLFWGHIFGLSNKFGFFNLTTGRKGQSRHFADQSLATINKTQGSNAHL